MKDKGKLFGQALVEFAIILPILVFLVIGVLSLGQAFQTYSRVSNGAREGAYFLANRPDDRGDCAATLEESDLNDNECYPLTKAAIRKELDPAGWDTIDAVVTIRDCCTNGLGVEVTVVQRVSLAGISWFTGPTTIGNTVRMMVLIDPAQ